MRTVFTGLCVVVLLSMTCVAARAAEPAHAATTGAAHASATAGHHDAQPVLPKSSPLGGSMIILIGGLFLAAAIVGPVVRYHAPEDAPEVSHDEHGHGAHDAHGHDAHGHAHDAHGHGH